MAVLPASTFGRLGLLISSVVLALFLLMALALRAFGLGPSGRIYADLLIGNARLAMQSQALPANVRIESEPPARARPARLPAQRLVQERAHEVFGPGAGVRFEDGLQSRAWIQSEPGAKWVGVRIPAFAAHTLGLGLWVMAAAALLVLLAAWWFARHLSEPLERLAEHGRALGRGQAWRASEDANAPREVRQLQATLAAAAAELGRAARERELLLAGVSHDLRTPLARLRLALELESGLAAPEREAMVADVEQMDAIVGQFLDWVRDGREEADTPCALDGLAQELAAESARAQYEWAVEAAAPVTVPGRALALRRAVRNLMRNAERYGRPPFRLRVYSDPIQAMACLGVADAGPGPPMEIRARLGEPFVRIAGADTGTGLGLALVERVARAHGGRLVLESGSAGFEATLLLPL